MDHDLPDRHDELRREWIAEYSGVWTMQKRRAEMLNRRIRRRVRRSAGARPNPHDDNVTHPLWARHGTTAESVLERCAVMVCAVVAPLGWPVGRLLYRRVADLIPGRLRTVPITALLWSAVGIGVLTAAAYSPDATFTVSVLAPYLIAQVPATFAAAGVYAVLEGWLAVDGSATWWPVTPPPPSVDLDLAFEPDDLTSPSIFDTADPDPQPHAVASTQIGQSTEPTRLVTAGLVACLIGSTWTIGAVLIAVLDVLTEVF